MTEQITAKPRYEILDGLRGVAALIVVAFHLFETYSQGPAYQILNHGYLAVDFFFLLSGFVIAYAYDDRKTMGFGTFAKRRLIRLHPMVIAGGVIPAQDYDFLYQAGVAAIFGPGTSVAKAACEIMNILLDKE